jgi:formylglycine-generating enzyme required for sulfatase activity
LQRGVPRRKEAITMPIYPAPDDVVRLFADAKASVAAWLRARSRCVQRAQGTGPAATQDAMNCPRIVPCHTLRVAQTLAAWLIASTALAAPGIGPGAPFRDCGSCPEMVVVPTGRFLMGTAKPLQVPTEVPAELDPVEVRIERRFALGRHEVTRAEYAEFARATGRDRRTVRCRTWVESRQGFADLQIAWDAPNVPATPRPDHPATCIDWHDARAYAAWLAARTGQPYRLPSEAEWEYAAKAGSRALQSWGASPRRHCAHANSNDRSTMARYPLAWRAVDCDDGFPDVAPVGSLRPNAFGLYDMIGNVWEWIEDCASLSYFGRPTDQRAWVWDGGCKRRIQRGGGWSTGPERSRPGFHGDGDDEDRADFAGFRVARDVP